MTGTRVSVLPAAETVLDVDLGSQVPCELWGCGVSASWVARFSECGHCMTFCDGCRESIVLRLPAHNFRAEHTDCGSHGNSVTWVRL